MFFGHERLFQFKMFRKLIKRNLVFYIWLYIHDFHELITVLHAAKFKVIYTNEKDTVF